MTDRQITKQEAKLWLG